MTELRKHQVYRHQGLWFAWMSFALLVIFAQSPTHSETSEQLRAIWRRGDLAHMAEIANTGNVRAQAWMGLMLQNRGYRAEAKKWYRLAAEKGDRFALHTLAEMYFDEKRYAEAAQWFKRGADAGDPVAQERYGSLLSTGTGVAKDIQAAAHFWQAAASQGYSYSFMKLAKIYSTGTGVPRDLAEAYVYVELAATTSDDSEYEFSGVAALKKQLSAELTQSQLAAAKERAQALREKLPKSDD